jgi:hypothetical protein
MKSSILVFFVLCFLTCDLFSQALTPLIGSAYITNVGHSMVYGVSAGDTKDSGHTFFVGQNTKFTVVRFSKDNDMVIVFWDYPNDTEGSKGSSALNFAKEYDVKQSSISSWANKKEFIMELKTFNAVCSIYYGKKVDFTWGAMTLPLKIRFGNGTDRDFNVEENLNLGFAIGLKKQLASRHLQSLNYLVFCSMGRVQADSASFKIYTPAGSNTPVPYPAPSSNVASALSTGLGCVYQNEGSFQVGLFIGADYITGNIGGYWKYQGKPWLGVALGISLFTQSKVQSGATGNNTTPPAN